MAGREKDELFIGDGFPVGKRRALSAREAAEFRAILGHAKRVEVRRSWWKRKEVVGCVHPAPELCYVRVDGETYYFMPPGELSGWTLLAGEEGRFRRAVAGVIGRKDRSKN